MKGTYWEGGVRVPAFVYTPGGSDALLPAAVRGVQPTPPAPRPRPRTCAYAFPWEGHARMHEAAAAEARKSTCQGKDPESPGARAPDPTPDRCTTSKRGKPSREPVI